jgi:hypothetical protein
MLKMGDSLMSGRLRINDKMLKRGRHYREYQKIPRKPYQIRMAELPIFHLEAPTAGHVVTAAAFRCVFDIRVVSEWLHAGNTAISLRD